jgi:hypothetical protein
LAIGIERTARTSSAADIAVGSAVETMTYSADALVPSAGMAWLATNSPHSETPCLSVTANTLPSSIPSSLCTLSCDYSPSDSYKTKWKNEIN